jgi:hypothetical protein
MSLLNFPMNVIPGGFTKALVNAQEAQKLVGGPDIDMGSMHRAIQLLAESNAILIHLLTENQLAG